jgi:hypothetical protein
MVRRVIADENGVQSLSDVATSPKWVHIKQLVQELVRSRVEGQEIENHIWVGYVEANVSSDW